jgi:hypothetical protein
MLGHGGLREAKCRQDVADAALTTSEIDQDVSTTVHTENIVRVEPVELADGDR